MSRDPALLWKVITWDLFVPYPSLTCSSVPLGPSSLQVLFILLLGVLFSVFMQCFIWLLTLGLGVAPQLCSAFICIRNFCFFCYISLNEPDTQKGLWLSFSPLPIGIPGREVKSGKKFSLDAENNFVRKSKTAVWGVFISPQFIKIRGHCGYFA